MIWVSSSAVLVVVCALSLFWVLPRLQRDRGDPVEAQVEITDTGLAPDDLDRHSEPTLPVTRRRRITMATTDITSELADIRAEHRSGTGSLRIKWDRTVLFLGGCVALLAGLIMAVVAPFSAVVTWPWPVFLLLLAVGSVLALRYLAVQEHAARRASARPAADRPADPHAPREGVALFDNEHARSEEIGEPGDRSLGEPDPSVEEVEQQQAVARAAFTVEELRAEALRVARESARTAPSRTWEPVPVPRPTYAEAPVVQRPDPEPLSVPEQPAARSATLKDAVRTGEERGRAGLDLDDVLKRRRA